VNLINDNKVENDGFNPIFTVVHRADNKAQDLVITKSTQRTALLAA